MPLVTYDAVGRLARRSRLPGWGRVADLMVKRPQRVAYVDVDGLRRRSTLPNGFEARLFLGVAMGLDAEALAHVQPGATVVDLGANIGAVTGQLCRRVGPTGRVIAVEPLPANVAHLQALKADNDLGQLIIEPSAVSDAPGTATLRVEQGEASSPYGTMAASWVEGASFEVPTKTLDDLLAEHDATRPAFVKLDVEGLEARVLAGAERTLREARPLVHCEFNDVILRDGGSSARGLLDRFAQHGYRPLPAWQEATRSMDGKVTDLLLGPS